MKGCLLGGLGRLALLLISLGIGGVLCETAVRWKWPWLLPSPPRSTRPDSGLPADRWAEKQRLFGKGDVYFIGDSFVETGEVRGGWLRRLREGQPRRLVGVGFATAAPSQYLYMLDSLRAVEPTKPVVLVVYLGNDWADEALFVSLGSDRSTYPTAHRRFYGDPRSPLFAPCFERPSGFALLDSFRERSAAYRLAVILRHKPTVFREGWTDQDYVDLMAARCADSPGSERIGGRIFFFAHHDALLNDSADWIQRGRDEALAQLGRHRGDRHLTVVVVLDREETCKAFHGRELKEAAPVVEQLRARGLDVADPTESFAQACSAEELYLPDGHWNGRGHELFAAFLHDLLNRMPATAR